MKNKSIRKSRFTLIELLVVIGIIGILTGILLPAISGSMKEGKKTKVRATCNQIALAVEGYLNDYGSLPIDPLITTDVGSTQSPITTSLLNILGGDNARSKSFFQNTGTLSHPFGGTYIIVMDADYDNDVEVSIQSDDVAGPVAVYSVCDGDTVVSWEK